jgi:hypothetical protein
VRIASTICWDVDPPPGKCTVPTSEPQTCNQPAIEPGTDSSTGCPVPVSLGLLWVTLPRHHHVGHHPQTHSTTNSLVTLLWVLEFEQNRLNWVATTGQTMTGTTIWTGDILLDVQWNTNRSQSIRSLSSTRVRFRTRKHWIRVPIERLGFLFELEWGWAGCGCGWMHGCRCGVYASSCRDASAVWAGRKWLIMNNCDIHANWHTVSIFNNFQATRPLQSSESSRLIPMSITHVGTNLPTHRLLCHPPTRALTYPPVHVGPAYPPIAYFATCPRGHPLCHPRGTYLPPTHPRGQAIRLRIQETGAVVGGAAAVNGKVPPPPPLWMMPTPTPSRR